MFLLHKLCLPGFILIIWTLLIRPLQLLILCLMEGRISISDLGPTLDIYIVFSGDLLFCPPVRKEKLFRLMFSLLVLLMVLPFLYLKRFRRLQSLKFIQLSANPMSGSVILTPSLRSLFLQPARSLRYCIRGSR